MSVLREIIEVSQAPEVAFDAVADFSSSAEWDPGVAAPSGWAMVRLLLTAWVPSTASWVPSTASW